MLATALAFVCNLPQVSAAICGVNSLAQFTELLKEHDADTVALDCAEFAVQAHSALDPRLWDAG